MKRQWPAKIFSTASCVWFFFSCDRLNSLVDQILKLWILVKFLDLVLIYFVWVNLTEEKWQKLMLGAIVCPKRSPPKKRKKSRKRQNVANQPIKGLKLQLQKLIKPPPKHPIKRGTWMNEHSAFYFTLIR